MHIAVFFSVFRVVQPSTELILEHSFLTFFHLKFVSCIENVHRAVYAV